MSESYNTVSLNILGKTYKVKCPQNKVVELRESAQYLEDKMREMSHGNDNHMLGVDRLLVVSALNIAHELLDQKRQANNYMDVMGQHIQNLQQKVEHALAANSAHKKAK